MAALVGQLGTGDCFGEASYVPGARRSASVRTEGNVTLLKVGATLLEQVLCGLPAALQSRVPALADRAPAEVGAGDSAHLIAG